MSGPEWIVGFLEPRPHPAEEQPPSLLLPSSPGLWLKRLLHQEFGALSVMKGVTERTRRCSCFPQRRQAWLRGTSTWAPGTQSR